MEIFNIIIKDLCKTMYLVIEGIVLSFFSRLFVKFVILEIRFNIKWHLIKCFMFVEKRKTVTWAFEIYQ